MSEDVIKQMDIETKDPEIFLITCSTPTTEPRQIQKVKALFPYS